MLNNVCLKNNNIANIIGMFLLFILFNHHATYAMGEVPMSVKFKSAAQFRQYTIPAEVFQLKNYPPSATITLSKMDQDWLNNALVGLMAIMSGHSELEEQAPNLGKYRPHFPKNPARMPTIMFLAGNIFTIEIFSASQNKLWYDSFVLFDSKSVTLTLDYGDLFKSLDVEFIKLVEMKYSNSSNYATEDQKKFTFYYAYHFQSKSDPRIELIFNVWPDRVNKKTNFPLTFHKITILRHD